MDIENKRNNSNLYFPIPPVREVETFKLRELVTDKDIQMLDVLKTAKLALGRARKNSGEFASLQYPIILGNQVSDITQRFEISALKAPSSTLLVIKEITRLWLGEDLTRQVEFGIENNIDQVQDPLDLTGSITCRIPLTPEPGERMAFYIRKSGGKGKMGATITGITDPIDPVAEGERVLGNLKYAH